VTTHAGEGQLAREHKEELKKLVMQRLMQARQGAIDYRDLEPQGPGDYLADANKDPTYLDDFDGPTIVSGGLFGQTKYLYTWSVDFQGLPDNFIGTGPITPTFWLESCELKPVRYYPGLATEGQP